jgi:hypothetical protein
MRESKGLVLWRGSSRREAQRVEGSQWMVSLGANLRSARVADQI